MKKRISAMMATILLVSAFLCGCGGGEKVKLFGEEEANFLLVRSADASETAKGAIKSLKDKIEENINIAVTYKPDTVAYQSDVLEVNIGVTNRAHAQSIYDELVANENNAYDYAIQFKDNVIYIVGVTDEALVEAVDYFYDEFCKRKSASIKTDYAYQYHYDKGNDFAIAGDKDLSDYSIVTPKYNMSYLIGREIKTLQQAFMTATASIVPELTDNNAETEREIIIGNTAREGAPEITDEDEYRITLSGKKLYVTGGSDKATAIAVKELARMAEKGTPIKADADIKGSYKEAVKNYENYYSLTWADEFDTIKTGNWVPLSGTFTHSSNYTEEKILRMVSDEESLYVEDGILYMRASEDEEYYNSVELRTSGLRFKYGLVECSSKFNISSGIATAFWLLADRDVDFHSEFDIFESQGAPNNKVKVTPISHTDNAYTDDKFKVDYCGAIQGDDYVKAAYTLDEGETFDDEFHTFGCEWDETTFTFTLDGRAFITMDITGSERAKQTYNDYVKMILTIYSGVNIGRDTGFPDETTDWENSALVTDYVRLYQLPGQELIIQ